ncbi:MAG: hypothetical protein AB7O13_13435, partial [Alphaproteobacteria bacterium]
MAVIIGGGLELRSSVTDMAATALNGVFGLEIVAIGGKRFVYAAGNLDDGLTAFELGINGSLTPIQTIGDTGTTALNGAARLISATVGGQTYLYVTAEIEDGISVFRVDADGKLTVVDTVFDDVALELNGSVGKMSVANVGGASYLLASGFTDDGFSIFSIGADGRLTNVQNVDDQTSANYELRGAADVAVGATGGRTFAFVAGRNDHGISSFEIAQNGTLTFASSVADNATLELNAVFGLATATIGSTLFLFAAGYGDHGISVFSIDSQGQFNSVFNLSDSTALGLGWVWNLSTFEIGGRTYLAASSQESALSYFEVAADGSLTPVTTLFDTAGLALNGGGEQQFTLFGGSAYLVAAGQFDDGVSVFEIGEDNETLVGTAAADTIYGLGGNDILSGLAGNDTLNGGGGNDVMIGGAGADVHDGGTGIDRAQYHGSPAGLTVDLQLPANNTGIAAGDTYISVENLYGSNFADDLRGDAGANVIWGVTGDDVLSGRAGGDTLLGGDGDDVMIGGVGADVHNGGAGIDRAQYHDSPTGLIVDLQLPAINTGIAAGDSYFSVENLYGSNFADHLRGDAGANVIWGAAGDDIIHGRVGDDTLLGGAGNDVTIGGAGADAMLGGAGIDRAQYTDSPTGLTVDLQLPANNTGIAAGDSYFSVEYLYGSNFADDLRGDAGANVIWGGTGDDI